ncbi:MAG: hypothetical protein IPI67_18250 [Myxococcales bacterium]|nr:hypothetical protein [Myxococcales bacterium]
MSALLVGCPGTILSASVMSRQLLLALFASTAFGCGAQPLEPMTPPAGGGPTPTQAGTDAANKGGVWSECYATFSPSGAPKEDLARLTRSCGATGGMQAVTAVQTAEQSEKDPADRYTFYVPNSGACYRVYAVGDRNVSDLDVLLRGPDGADVTGDVSHDAFPVTPPSGPICFDVPGLYMLEVSVFRGSGRYALQVWGNASGLGKLAPKP